MGRAHVNRQIFNKKFGFVDGLYRLGCPGQRVRHFYFTRSGHRVRGTRSYISLIWRRKRLFVKNFTSNENPSSFVVSRPATSTAKFASMTGAVTSSPLRPSDERRALRITSRRVLILNDQATVSPTTL